jgi:diguanylate cyclase (GGDEF)-like protein/PAS domain S-box-containing protein
MAEKVGEMPLSIDSYSDFIETIPDAMLLVDRLGKIALANSQVGVLFGYELDELRGQSVQILVPDLKRETHAGHMTGFLANPRRRMMGSVMKLTGRRKDGSECPVDIMLSVTVIDGNQFVVCAVRDTTQIRQMQDALNRAYEHEKELARVDPLTGAANQRSFHELAEREIERSYRYKYPFTLGYFDLDDFKAVNDRFGHTTGDEILKAVVKHASDCFRKTDLFARLGGDEFSFLLAETGPEKAQMIISRFQQKALLRIQGSNEMVTFSIGALTCVDASLTLEEILKLVDDLMYSVKREGKASVKHSVYGA